MPLPIVGLMEKGNGAIKKEQFIWAIGGFLLLTSAIMRPNPCLMSTAITLYTTAKFIITLRSGSFLQNKGYRFSSQSDTEVILAAYDFWKEKCLQQFDGMFAFAIWDEKEEQLFAARDRFGEKPFYYYEDEEHFIFASEMKALWAIGIEKKIDNKMLLNYLTLGSCSKLCR